MTSISTVASLISRQDWDGLYEAFGKMSNSEFRRIETQIREHVLPTLQNDTFWDAYLHLIMFRKQSFLSGILAISHLIRTKNIQFQCDEARKVACWLKENSPESIIKVLRMAVPLLDTYEMTEELFTTFKTDSLLQGASILVAENSSHAYYVLFNMLKAHADDHESIKQVCLGLIRKNTDLSFNMASILRCYFDIKDIKSTFSLDIQPYELSYIDKSYENFNHVLQGKRPRI